MRLPEQMEEAGYFWLPEKNEKKLPGTLRITDTGKITLEVLGLFGDLVDELNNRQVNLKRIVGVIEEGRFVTLDRCRYGARTFNYNFPEVSKSQIDASLALFGVHYDENEPITFSKMKFSVEGLDEWLSISGIKVSHDWKANSATIKYTLPQELSISLPNNISLTFTFGRLWSSSETNPLTEAKVTQKAYISLEAKDLQPLDFFSDVIFKLTTLFCFAIDETVTLTSVTGFASEIKTEIGDDEPLEIPIELYYQSRPFSEVKPNIERNQMLFRYDHIRNDFEKIVTNWLANYDVSAPAFHLYFSSKSGGHKYIEGRFLSLAQGIETLHRRNSSETLMPEDRYDNLSTQLIDACPTESKEWLKTKLKYGNELSLRTRLKQMIAPFHRFFGEVAQRKALVSKIVETRNYLTHYDPQLESSAPKGVELWKISRKLECLFQLHFLRLLGLADQDIDKIVTNNNEFKTSLETNHSNGNA